MSRWLSLVFAVVLLSFLGCSAKAPPSNSGFLGDASVYSALKPHPQFDGIRVAHFKPPTVVRGGSFIVPPVKIYLNNEGQEREIPQKELSELAASLHNKIYDQLSQDHKITNIPGPAVHTLRLAITDADPNVPALNIHPGSVISGAGLGGATVEMAIENSTTGELVTVATGSRKGARYKYVAGLSKWGHTEEVLTDFANLIRQRIDEINAAG